MSYSREIFAEAQKSMDQRRLNAEQELERRRSELYASQPRAGEIERELVSISVRAGRAVIMGADKVSKLEELKNRSLCLQKELAQILERNGLPANYLDPWYNCEKCRDTGNIDGKMCSCMKQLLRQTAYEELNKISPLSLCSFESFSLDYYPDDVIAMNGRDVRDYMKGVLNFCKKYADTFNEHSESLLFDGGTGLGKTHLSLSIAQEALSKGFGVIYVSAPNILSRLESRQFGGRSTARLEDEQLLQECDLLIIDDLGTEFVTRFTQATIYNMINSRINASKPVIISTNLTVKELEETYGSRMASRMIGMLRRVDFFGNDIRQLRRFKR